MNNIYLCLNEIRRPYRVEINSIVVRTTTSYRMGIKMAKALISTGNSATVYHKHESKELGVEIELNS